MLRHCVMFKWTDDATDDAKAAISAGLDQMAQLAMVASFVHGPDAAVSDGNWDYVVVADFDNDDNYRAYANDPDHLGLIADTIKPSIAARAAVQFHLA